ncbi:hypothetical protein ACFWY9_09640 [Amycolatopsis sp. NPDC059027]|uniref:hypothetical protein n=1 Tax=unclassified Amycolatopsis TaxID=2618356 RepID=UPI003670434D
MTFFDWKRAVYAMVALPAYFGGARAQRWLASRWLGIESKGIGKPRYLAAAGLGIPAFLIATLVWYLVGRIATFGFFWTEAGAAGSWGGPSLLGAWVVHFFAALGMVLVCLWLLRPLTTGQARLLAP